MSKDYECPKCLNKMKEIGNWDRYIPTEDGKDIASTEGGYILECSMCKYSTRDVDVEDI